MRIGLGPHVDVADESCLVRVGIGTCAAMAEKNYAINGGLAMLARSGEAHGGFGLLASVVDQYSTAYESLGPCVAVASDRGLGDCLYAKVGFVGAPRPGLLGEVRLSVQNDREVNQVIGGHLG